MRIDTAYNLTVYILRKERNGFVSIPDFNQVAPRAQLDVYNDFYALTPKNQVIHDALSPFKTSYDFTPVLSPDGVVTMPDDYVHLLSGYAITSGSIRPIIFPEEDELPYALTSELRPVSINYPLADEISMGVFQLYPAQGQSGKMWYLRAPTTPVYVFTLSGRTITYSNTSVDFEFADNYQNKIVAKCLQNFGVNLSDQEVMQYGFIKDKENE